MASLSRRIRQIVRILELGDAIRQERRSFRGAVLDASLSVLILKSHHIKWLSRSNVQSLSLIVHHGGNIHDLRVAKAALQRVGGGELGRQITDRILVMKGLGQVYGTQYRVCTDGSLGERFPMIGDR